MVIAASQRRSAQDLRAVPYQGAQPVGMLADFVEQGALDLDADERLWVPQAPDVKFRPSLFSVSQGYFVNLLRVRKAGILSPRAGRTRLSCQPRSPR
jgi:2,4'-dihydroxyacetophenone dioxygenase